MRNKIVLTALLFSAAVTCNASPVNFAGPTTTLYAGFGGAEYDGQFDTGANNIADRVMFKNQEGEGRQVGIGLGGLWNLAPHYVGGFEFNASTLHAKDRGNKAVANWQTYAETQLTDLYQLKGKLGYQSGAVMPYVTGGLSKARARTKIYAENGAANEGQFWQVFYTRGINLGAGLEWLSQSGFSLSLDTTKNVFTRGYMLTTDYFADLSGNVDAGDHIRVNSAWLVQLGVGFHFS